MIDVKIKNKKHTPEQVKRRIIMDAWDNRPLPDNAFEDDPRADNYDRHGNVRSGSNSNLRQSRWDLGEFPPNE